MMKNYSSWNQQQFNEYLYKSHQYEMNNNFTNYNPINLTNSSFDNCKSKSSNVFNNREKELDDFYLFPGKMLANEYEISYNRIDSDEDFFTKSIEMKNLSEFTSNQNEKFGFNSTKSKLNSFNFNNTHLIKFDECDYGDSKLNLFQNNAASVPMNASFNSLQKAYITAAYNLKTFMESIESSKSNSIPSILRQTFDNISQIDKSAQTTFEKTNEFKLKKTSDKVIQTKLINTRNNAASTDASLMKIWFDNQSKLNKLSTKQSNNKVENIDDKNNKTFLKTHTIDADLSIKTPSPVIWPLKFEPSKYSQSKIINSQLKSRKTVTGLKGKSKSNKTFSTHLSDTENESLVGNDSNLDELTMISKTNSKFASFNDILENLGLHLQNSGASIGNVRQKFSNTSQNKENHFNSFWDNPLDKFELINSETHDSNSKKGLLLKCSEQTTDQTNQIRNENHIKLKPMNHEIEISKPNFIETEEQKINLKLSNELVDCISMKTSIKDNKSFTKPNVYNLNSCRKSNTITSGIKFSKSFYLNPYDDLVKSHFNPSDRRIKSVSSKNGSIISIEGPINAYDNCSESLLTKSKIIYRCTISSINSENLDKCINYLKETFPNTYLCNGVKSVFK